MDRPVIRLQLSLILYFALLFANSPESFAQEAKPIPIPQSKFKPLQSNELAAMSYEQMLDKFEPYPTKCDMLVVVAHPDDESYLMGLLPYYSVCRQKKVVVVCLTSGEWGNGLPHHKTADEKPDYSFDDSEYPRYEKVPKHALYPSYFREEEMARALLAYGVKYKPVMPRFKDMSGLQPWGSPDPCFALWGGRDKVVGFITSQIRKYKPDVVVSIPFDGANGNPQHCAASHGAMLAFEAAGSSRNFPEQIKQTRAWTPQKMYMCVSGKELKQAKYKILHKHDWDLPCAGCTETARAMAARGKSQHMSQEMKEECDESTSFVLVHSNVGNDKKNHNDLFENTNPDIPLLQ